MDDKSYKVYESKGQLRITIPKVLANALDIKKGDRITWKIDRGELVLRKVS
ncbi:MAG: AbrB/MazE/SpoVT family DNA-binding domain-containing protein [Euryarchaeota archaeon]|nr:AbrB/MazE/SpoVT family DNA-binding domain-containing protein [Euryarchaeota archaeon]